MAHGFIPDRIMSGEFGPDARLGNRCTHPEIEEAEHKLDSEDSQKTVAALLWYGQCCTPRVCSHRQAFHGKSSTIGRRPSAPLEAGRVVMLRDGYKERGLFAR